jgi:hypothetical protein
LVLVLFLCPEYDIKLLKKILKRGVIMEKKIKNEYRCQDCPAYVPGCCTVDNMPADDKDTCKFTGVFENLKGQPGA